MIHPWHDIRSSDKHQRVLGTATRILFATLALAVPPALPAQTQKADDIEIRNLMDVYAETVNKADATLASQVWCGSAEESVTNPGGSWQGPQQINSLYALLSDSYSERKLTFDMVSIHSYVDFAWTEFTGDFTAKQRKDGAPFSFHAAETQIYRKLQGRWCLVHVHYATFPAQAPGAK